MKLPKSFIPKKNLDKNMKELLVKKQSHNPETLQLLIEHSKEFIEKQKQLKEPNLIYYMGESLIRDLTYNKKDLEAFSKMITVEKEEDRYLGFYLSALINKLGYVEKEIILQVNAKLRGIGTHLNKAVSFKDITLNIEGDVYSHAGFFMRKGKLVIGGNAGNHAGTWMEGGELIVEGSVGEYTGYRMEKHATMRVYGKIESIHEATCKGEIYQGDKLVWPKK